MRSILIAVLLSFIFSLNADTQNVNWLTWEEALELNQKEKRKFLVDVYTDWCGWCKKMEATTFSDEKISEYINENYYAVKFNAEQKSDIIYNNKVYQYVGGFGIKGVHELAKEIMRGKVSYPTVVFINSNLEVIQPIPGYQDVDNFEMIMTFFAEEQYMNKPWNQFVADYKRNKSGKVITPKDIQPKVQTVKNK
jgi:thioredoxin-related protein